MEKDKIKEVLNGMFDNIEKKQIELYYSLIDKKCPVNITDIEEFYFGLIYPFEEYISGLVRSEISNNRDVVFIFQNSQFIENHFVKLIETIEGSACSADKSRTILKRLFDFYKNGNKINFDYTQEYTFHLPKIVFKTHENIIEFYEGLKNLYYGNNEKYLKALLNIKILIDLNKEEKNYNK